MTVSRLASSFRDLLSINNTRNMDIPHRVRESIITYDIASFQLESLKINRHCWKYGGIRRRVCEVGLVRT